jgi:hypothetical protein
MKPSGHAVLKQRHDRPVSDGRSGEKSVLGYPRTCGCLWTACSKPETFGLRKGSRAMMGMMTMVRVLPPALYDQIQERIRARKTAADGGRA